MRQIVKIIKSSQNGQVALFSFLIISFFTLLWATTTNLIGVDKMEEALAKQKVSETFFTADGCINHALGQLKYDAFYSGETLTIGEEQCVITVDHDYYMDMEQKTIKSSSTIYNKTRRIEAVVNLTEGNPNELEIFSWQEVY